MGRKNKRIGFTLIELLVVVAIVAILAAMLLPALSKARARARNALCMSNLKQIYIAFTLYENDYSSLPNYYWDAPYLIYNMVNWDKGWDKHGKLFGNGYLKTAEVFYCPFTSIRYSQNYSYRRAFKPYYSPATNKCTTTVRSGYILRWYMTPSTLDRMYINSQNNVFRRRQKTVSLMYDIYATGAGIPWETWFQDGTSCNILYTDGSVKNMSVSYVKLMLGSVSPTGSLNSTYGGDFNYAFQTISDIYGGYGNTWLPPY